MANANTPEEESPSTENQPDQMYDETETFSPPTMVSISKEELDLIKKDAEVYKDKYLHLLADMDNMRKRLQKERHELIQYAIQNVLVDVLNPIDHLENALKHAEQASDEVKHWALGFQMILNQFKDVLSNNGVVPFQSEGTPFDPHFHEAVEMVPSKDYPPGTVIAESIRGYKMGDKVIRPARVKVAKAPEGYMKTSHDKLENNKE